MSTRESARPLRIFAAEDASVAERAASEWIDRWRDSRSGGAIVPAPPPAAWPFADPLVPPLSLGPVVIVAGGVHEAFVNHQTAATRLVTTQAVYLCETWSEALRAHGNAWLVATADLASLRQHAPEVIARRGLFADAVVDVSSAPPHVASRHLAPSHLVPPHPAPLHVALLVRAFRSADPSERLRLCVDALEQHRSPAALVAAASVCMEVNDLDAAGRDLAEALTMAPGWAAAHFELGKLWLRRDDMARASEAFRAATRALPGFGPAWANLGATLGELDRPQEALEAFDRALACDPTSAQALNNVGVVRRELGRLADSEAAFRQVIQLAPDLAFGYYNLGHTLFLQGRYRAALSAYAEGQARDADRNPVQATRLALCKVATGDATGGLRDLQQATSPLPKEYRRQLLADTSAVLWALVTQTPELTGWQPVHAWMSGELERSREGQV